MSIPNIPRFFAQLFAEGTLLDHADELRQARIGHADPLTDERHTRLRAYLWFRLQEWREPSDEWEAMVMRMVKIELDHANAEHARRTAS